MAGSDHHCAAKWNPIHTHRFDRQANTGVANQRPNVNPAGGSPTFHKSLSSWFDKTKYVVAPQFTYGQVKAFTCSQTRSGSMMPRFSNTLLCRDDLFCR